MFPRDNRACSASHPKDAVVSRCKQGECVLTVQLDDEDVPPAAGEEEKEEEADLFLLFSGSSQSHLSSTLRVGRVTLQAVCPAHDVCEQVLVTLCKARPGGPVHTLSQETFCFIQDLALDMAHFLLDSKAPQEALLFDDEQIPLEECERLDQNLALALQHLSLTHHGAGPVVEGSMTVTDSRGDTEVPTVLDSRTVSAASRRQQLCSLLHLAARHGLGTVAAFLLQQPGGREALSRPNAQGLTAARLAESRGHGQLAELFALYETSLDVQAEEPHFSAAGRLFQHHANLGTYTLTFQGPHRMGGGAESEVEELRRRICLHMEDKGQSACATRDSAFPAGGMQPCLNGMSAVTMETCSTTIEEQGRPRSLEERAQGQDPAVVTHASGTSGPLCQRQEAGGEQKGTPAASSPAARSRKSRKRTTKSTKLAAECPGSNQSPQEAAKGSARRPAKTTGSSAETQESVSVIGATKPHMRAEDTHSPTKPESTAGADGKCAGRKAGLLSATAIIEKQEGEKWEVDLLTCERVAGTEAVTKSFPAEDAERTAAMGQDQSQDQRGSQSDQDEPGPVDPMETSRRSGGTSGSESPDTTRKPRRVLWRDGGWMGSRMGSVWYQGGKLDEAADEGGDREEAKSLSVWYHCDTVDGGKDKQLEQEECGWSSAQLLEQPRSSHQLSSALSQPRAAGTQPALSHGPAAQRQEVHGSQGEEEVGPVWKQGGVQIDGEEASGRDTSRSRKASETADFEEGVEGESHGSGDKGAKGRKRRRKKRGRKGADGKLSSNSSIESPSQREQVSDLNAALEDVDVESPTNGKMHLPMQTRDARGPAITRPDPSESPLECERTDVAGVTASRTKEEKKDLSEGDGRDTDSVTTAPDLQMEIRKAQTVPPVEQETLYLTQVDQPVHQAVANVQSEPLFVNEDQTAAGYAAPSVDRTALLESNCPKELPVKLSDPTEWTHGSSDQQHEEEKRNEEEAGGERSRSRENNGGMDASVDSSLDQEDHNQGMVATAVAIVTVAIASAMASIELSQQLADNRSERQEPINQMPRNSLEAVQPAQLMDKENCRLPADEKDNPPTERSLQPTERFAPEEQANVVISVDCGALQCNNGTEKPSAARLASNQTVKLDPLYPLAIADTLQKEEMQTESTPNKVCRYLLAGEEDRITHVDGKTLTESHERIPSEGDCHSGVLVKIQQRLRGPVTEPCKHPGASGTICSGSEIPATGEHGGVQHTLRADHSPPLASVTAEREVPHGFKALEDSDPEGERDPLPPHCGGQIQTSLLTCSPSPPPIVPCDSALWANPSSDQPPGPELPLADTKLVPALPLQNQVGEPDQPDPEGGGVEGLQRDCLDTVDGWKKLLAVDVTSHTAVEKEQQQARRDSDSTHNLQIQRETDVFCPEPNTETTCADICTQGGECVSVCLLHSDTDGVKVNAQPDDGIFKKPRDPPPFHRHRDRGVRVSWGSDKDASIRGGLGPFGGTPEAVTPRSSKLSWKSETEDRGGGGGAAAEEEEEKDQLVQNPLSSAILRASLCSSSPLRRHSWEPTRSNAAAHTDVAQRSMEVSHVNHLHRRRSTDGPPVPCLSLLKRPSGEGQRAKPPVHRRSMSWCPSNLRPPDQEQIDSRSYSLEALELQTHCPSLGEQEERSAVRGSLVSLTEEEQEGDASSMSSQGLSVTKSCSAMFHHQTLTKSISMVAISPRDIDATAANPESESNMYAVSVPVGGSAFSSNSGSLEYSISEEEPGPLRSEAEAKGGPKISRTFSYIRNKMTKKSKEKERKGERERESKEREKKSASGHLFMPVSPPASTACQHCSKLLNNKETFLCSNCGAHVHKCCRESLPICSKSKTKQQQLLVPEAAPGSAINMRSKSTSSASSVSSTSSSSSRERWSTATSPDDQLPLIFPRRHPSLFNPHSNLAKSISTSNIAGLDDVSLKGLKFLSQSTDSLHKGGKVNASTESLTDEGTEMMDSQLMGEFECDTKDLEGDSWSGTMDKKFLKTLKKDEIKKQDVIYELYQTEFHHVRTLKIMSEVYYKGLQKELQLDSQTLDKIFPVLDDMLDTHTHFLTLLLERKKASSTEGRNNNNNNNNFLILSIGDVLLNQFSGCSADRMKKVYGKFCSRHNEAVNLYKDLHAKDKRFQAFIKRTMSSSIVRRLSIPECILLVTQRITKYPVLIQRILQHTKDSDDDHGCVCEALRCVKEAIQAVDSKVNEQEKKQKLREVYSRTDSKSIMRMKSGQMFAKEDLIRGRKLLHDGALQLKNSAGRLKDVQAMLLSDVLVFLQEKDQKYVFASLDQRSTVISLQNLIVREVANEERGLFLITAGIEKPEMVEVLASSKEERNTWRAIIQDAMHCMEKDEDEGVPSETEEDRRQQESRVKEIRELLRRKDEQIVSLLEEKVHIFRDLGDSSPAPDDANLLLRERMLFMATPDDVTKGEPIMMDALREVETLHGLVNSGVGGAGCGVPVSLTGGSVGLVCLPRRAETFGGFDSHQMNSTKNGEREEGDESLDLRRTESDSVLKKGATASLQMLLKRNNEVQHSVTHLHGLLISLQAVVVQQDSYIEDQRQTLSERLAANSSRHSSSSSLSSSSSSRPSSLIEQEKHRSLERQRQEAATLQKQQAAHQEEKRRREKAWEQKDRCLAEREERMRTDEEQTRMRHREVTEEWEMLRRRREEYQVELERLREAQRRLDRDKEALKRDTERLEAMKKDESEQLHRYQRTPSTTSEESIRFHSSGSLDLELKEAAEKPRVVELSTSAPTKEPFLRIGSKRMKKNFNPFSSSSSSSKTPGAEKESQLPGRLLQLTKPKEKDKRKKKGKGEQTPTESTAGVMLDPQNDGDIFFC
ncbi:uncharacterized protein AB9W97_012741 isoform 4-T4 [Spinachia spinachia]